MDKNQAKLFSIFLFSVNIEEVEIKNKANVSKWKGGNKRVNSKVWKQTRKINEWKEIYERGKDTPRIFVKQTQNKQEGGGAVNPSAPSTPTPSSPLTLSRSRPRPQMCVVRHARPPCRSIYHSQWQEMKYLISKCFHGTLTEMEREEGRVKKTWSEQVDEGKNKTWVKKGQTKID